MIFNEYVEKGYIKFDRENYLKNSLKKLRMERKINPDKLIKNILSLDNDEILYILIYDPNINMSDINMIKFLTNREEREELFNKIDKLYNFLQEKEQNRLMKENNLTYRYYDRW
jgi:GTP-binding protein EngB required for normal cell division